MNAVNILGLNPTPLLGRWVTSLSPLIITGTQREQQRGETEAERKSNERPKEATPRERGCQQIVKRESRQRDVQ